MTCDLSKAGKVKTSKGQIRSSLIKFKIIREITMITPLPLIYCLDIVKYLQFNPIGASKIVSSKLILSMPSAKVSKVMSEL